VPAEAADELLARMLAYLRHRGAAAWLAERAADGQRFLDRQARLPATLRAAKLDRAPEGSLSPDALGAALGELLRTPPPLDLAHLADPRVALPSGSLCCEACSVAARSPSRKRSAERTG
jgi:segregation and condensation protein A